MMEDVDQATNDLICSIDPETVYRRHTICRTTLLPSQLAMRPGLREESVNASSATQRKGAPVLVVEPTERQECEG